MNTTVWRVWFFRGAVALAAALLITSAALPWWTCIVEHSQYGYQGTIKIYEFGILYAPTEVAGDITSPLEVFLGMAYISSNITLMMWSTVLRKEKGRLVLALVGLAYIGYSLAAAYLVITPRITDFGGLLQGYSEIMIEPVGEMVLITTSLQEGYYLALAAGIFCFILAVLEPLIRGKSRPEIKSTKIGNREKING